MGAEPLYDLVPHGECKTHGHPDYLYNGLSIPVKGVARARQQCPIGLRAWRLLPLTPRL